MNTFKLTTMLLLTTILSLSIDIHASKVFTDLEGKFIQADSLTWVGKASDTKKIYHRVDTAIYKKMPQKVKSLFTNSAGMAIAFTIAPRFRQNGRLKTAKGLPTCLMSIRWD